MIRKITLSLLACMVMCLGAWAQQCGFDLRHQQLMAKDPAYAANVNQYNTKWINWQQLQQTALWVTLPNGKSAWEIPVVVHVIYTNEKPDYNPSDADIQAWINYLNDAWQATFGAYPDTTAGGTRMPIVFKLAKRTPNCTPTNGILRYQVTQASNIDYYNGGIDIGSGIGEDETVVKGWSIWPNTDYYNIWIVNRLDGADGLTPGTFTAGYAYFPGAAATIDGTVVLASQVDVAPNKSTLIHEMGHAFSLYHVFQGGSTSVCPPSGPCTTTGDLVCDTEPQMQSAFNCPSNGSPTPTNPCTSLPWNNGPHNFMDYSNCKDRFTSGQRDRINTALNGPRASLKYSLGATPLPATTLPATCAVGSSHTPPSLNFGPRNITITTGSTQVFSNSSSGYQGDGNQHYIDNTCKRSIELVLGNTYLMNVQVQNTSKCAVFIDYNKDNDYSDPGETIFSGQNISTGSANFTFSVPTTGVLFCTPLRMRVIADINTTGALTACATLSEGQAEDYEVIIKGGNNTTTTGIVTIQDPPIGGNPSCDNSTLTLAGKRPSTAGITPVWYGWYHRSPSGAWSSTHSYSSTTDSVWTSNIFHDLDSVFVKVAYSGTCGIDTTISDTITLYRPTSVAPSVTAGVTGGSNPTCVDEAVTLSVTGNVNPGAAPSPQYEWFKNGSTVAIGSGATLVIPASTTTSGDYFRVRMNMTPSVCNGNLSSVMSNTITITHTTKAPSVQIALTTGTNPGCNGQPLTFSVINSTIAGINPDYDWKVNGVSQGLPVNSTSFTTSTLNHGDLVTVEMLSKSPCAVPSTATSGAISIIFQSATADVTIAQVSGGNPVCSSHPAVFIATPVNGGPVPQYQWMINGMAIPTAQGQVFNTTSLNNNDVVQCILVSSDPCVSNTLDTSSGITMQVTPSKTPTVTFSLTKGNNPGCLDSLIEFTAKATDIGANPNFDWFVNGFGPVFNGDVFTSVDLLNGDAVTVRANQTDGGCYLPDTVFSAPVTMTLSPTPEPPIISLIGNNLVTNKSGAYIWFGPSGQLTNSSTGTYHPTVLGQYWCITDNNGCTSKPSNKLTITLLDINTYNIEQVEIFPNPTTGQLVLDWKHAVNMTIEVYSTIGQKLMQDEIRNQSKKTMDLSKLANGIYFVVVTDEQGKSGTARITVNK